MKEKNVTGLWRNSTRILVPGGLAEQEEEMGEGCLLYYFARADLKSNNKNKNNTAL